MHTTTTRARLARAAALTAAAGLVLAGCGTGATGAASAPPASDPAGAARAAHNDADISFAQGMIPHHRQAVMMAELAADRAQGDQVRDLATRISAAQQPEIDTMTSWLQEWGADVPAPDAGGGSMTGMDHGGGMAGMMSPEQMAQLSSASGVAFDRMFLQMMIEHHRGAIEMARVELAEGADPRATALAQTIIDTQQAEIDEMELLLQQS